MTPVAGGRARALRAGRARAVVIACAAAMFFVQAVVFAGMGLMLYAIAGARGWSGATAGAGFTVVIAGACLGATLAVAATRHLGAARTIPLGLALTGIGVALPAVSSGMQAFWAGTCLAGIGFSFAAQTPGVYLIAGWLEARADRTIGLYLMVGMLGNAVGPPLAQALIGAIGWRGYALAVLGAGLTLALATGAALREPPRGPAPEHHPAIATVLRTRTFAVLAAAVVVSQLCLNTVFSVSPPHLAAHGIDPAGAARFLGVAGIAATAITGASGFLTGLVPARRMLLAALLACGGGMVLLAAAEALPLAAVLLGGGVGAATLAVTLEMVAVFGREGGAAGNGAVWTLAGLAAFGPVLGGVSADGLGSFAPALVGLGLLVVPVAVGCLWLPKGQKPKLIPGV